MRAVIKKAFRSGIAMLLVCCMVVGIIPTSVFATGTTGTQTLNYVSLGDSMTNGYGLDGYNGNSGVLDYGFGSYTNQFADWLVAEGYADEVNHFQLALSAMRSEDLHWLLEVDYNDPEVISLIEEMDYNYQHNKDAVINQAIADGKVTQELRKESSKKAYFEAYADRWNSVFTTGDSWTWRELVHDYRFKVIANYINYYEAGNTNLDIDLKSDWTGYDHNMSDVTALKIVAKYFQDAVANADIVSNGIGNGNLGVFTLGRIEEAIGFGGKPVEVLIYKVENAIRECDPAIQTAILNLKDTLYTQLQQYVDVQGDPMMDALINSVVYGSLSYLLNWCGSIDAIVELNPDAEVIIMGLMNTMNGIKMEVSGVTIDVGQWMGVALDSLNAYMAGYPVVMQLLGHYQDATFYYAEERQVECYADTYNDTIYTSGIVRDRFVKSIVGEIDDDGTEDWELIWKSLKPVAASTGTNLQFITLDDVEYYESLNDQQKIAYAQSNGAKAMSIALYLASEKGVLRVLDEGGIMSADAAVALGNGTLTTDSVVALFQQKLAEYTPAVTQRICAAIGAENFAAVSESQQGMLVALFAMPDALGNALAEDEEIGGLLNLWAHCLLGNGLSGHPSQGGHDQLANAIEKAYGTGHTSSDQTLDNVEYLMNQLYSLVKAYGPEVAAQVWNQWVEYGYVDAVENSIAELEAMLKYYIETAIPAIEDAVKSLNDQKDALTAQLAALYAELEAKKAELEQLIANQADAALEAFETAKAELENVIAEIEATIENVESLIKNVENEIIEVTEFANSIIDAVKQLGDIFDDVADAAVALKNMVENVYDVLNNADLEQTAEEFIAAFNAAREAAINIAKTLEQAMDMADVMVDNVNVMIAKLVSDVNALYETVSDRFADFCEAVPEEAKAIVAAAIAKVNEELEVKKAELEEKLAEAIVAAEEEAAIKKAELEALYNEKVAEIEAELNAITEQIKAEVEAKYAELSNAYNAKLAELEAKKAELEAQLQQLKAELAEAADEVAAEIQAKIDEVNNTIAEVTAEINAVVAQIESAYNQAVAEVEAIYAQTVEALKNAIEEARAELDNAVAEVEEKLTAALEELKAETQKQLDVVIEATNNAIAALEELAGGLHDELDAYLEELNAEIVKAEAALKEIIAGSKEAAGELIDAVEAIVADGKAKLDALVDEVVTAVNAMLYQATHADLTIDDDFKYVALGDGSAVAEGYAEILAQYLNEEAANNGIKHPITLVNTASIGNTVADEMSDLNALAAKVYDADLITLGFSDVTFLANAFATTNVDWSKYVSDEYVPYIEQVVAELNKELLKSGLSERDSVYYTGLVNALAYSIVQYAVEMPMLVGAIHEINPDAVVVVVGTYNPLSGVSFDTGNGVIHFNNYVDYLVDAVAAHGLAYAMISGNAIYVDARDIKTNNTATELETSDLLKLLATQFEALYPSAADDTYIAHQVADALNLSYETLGLWGDADGNGVVNANDAELVLQYYALLIDSTELNLAVCDVNGDGVINATDAELILQYYARVIDAFPVER